MPHLLISLQPVTRESDGRRLFLVEFGGTPDEPAAISIVDPDDDVLLCDECGEPFAPGSNVYGIGQLVFHPDCAPAGDL